MHDCEYCETIRPGEENEKILAVDNADGYYDQLVVGCDEDNKIYLRTYGNFGATWYPNFCPVCGRNLLKYSDHPEDDPRFGGHFLRIEHDMATEE